MIDAYNILNCKIYLSNFCTLFIAIVIRPVSVSFLEIFMLVNPWMDMGHMQGQTSDGVTAILHMM